MHTWILAKATYGWIVRMPVYYFVLLIIGLLILFSPLFTLFGFHREQAMVREMGIASLTLWGFLVALLVSGQIVTLELEDRTALLLLSKPISRAGFLLGKFAGLVLALAAGVAFLGMILLFTFWWSFGLEAMESVRFKTGVATGEFTVWEYVRQFLARDGLLLAQGTLLSFFQVTLLAGAVVTLSAFFPIPVAGSASVFVYVLSNMTGYIRQAAESSGSSFLVWTGRVLYYLFPNLGYLNLQRPLSEGQPIAASYLLFGLIYTGLYLGCLMTIACGLFSRREIR